ncbi:uncharacterized protein UMAG_00550 [Mycosarcoma maydis]|uniref:Uncharacterized protein n=1 Tax=Mycosarcoma maydis TaxID=5270 RepID=A0A0D1EA35_MYCMD|nr:uncharacterized protein UMAG_00550 [Ustilago maydis 521]KIS72131.1 hypothetical protein UMAG_00550 [Ustilago maydis 521]|eukprot:XP_011386384.1 hypothetical protein UMAG_00550 [Ustilago maydis 521]
MEHPQQSIRDPHSRFVIRDSGLSLYLCNPIWNSKEGTQSNSAPSLANPSPNTALLVIWLTLIPTGCRWRVQETPTRCSPQVHRLSTQFRDFSARYIKHPDVAPLVDAV